MFQTKRGMQKIDITNDQRWQTILKAASTGLSYYCWTISVIGFNRINFISLLNEYPEKLKELEITIPPKENPFLKIKENNQKKLMFDDEVKLKQKEIERRAYNKKRES